MRAQQARTLIEVWTEKNHPPSIADTDRIGGQFMKRQNSTLSKRMILKAGIVAVVTLLAIVPISSDAATINVPGDQPNLNAAAAAALANDVIFLTAASYIEHVTFTVPVTITSNQNPFPIVDGQIRLSSPGGSSTVSNIQVSNTTNNAEEDGINIENATGATVLVDNCVLSGNFRDGVRADANGLTLTVQNCTVNGNMQRGIRYDGNYNGGPTTGASMTVDNCNLFDNGLANNVTNNNRGRCVEMGDNLNGALSVLNSNLTMTSDGTVDRGIQYDNGNLVGTSLTVINCDITAPLWDNGTLSGNRDGGGIRVNADMTGGVTIEDVNIRGFNDPIRLDGRDAPTSTIVIRNCTVNDFSAADTGGGTAILFEDIQGGGSALIENVQMIGLPGPKDTGGGNECLKIRDCDGLSVTIRGMEAGNTEEALTIDNQSNFNVTVEDSILRGGSGDAEQAFKFIHNANSTFDVSGSLAEGWGDGLDYTGEDSGAGAVTVSFADTTFTDVDGINFEPFFPDYGLSLTSCLLFRCDGGVNVAVDDPGATVGTVEVSNSTIHETTGSPINVGANATANVTVEYNVFTEWSGVALNHNSTTATLNENFNVFADQSDNARFGGTEAAAIVHGGGSLQADNQFEIYCDLDPFSATFLSIRQDGPAFEIDGSNNAGAFPACLVTASVEAWELYR